MGFDWLPAKNYKKHYICFKCKKGFKKPSQKDIKHSVATDVCALMDTYYKSNSNQSIIDYIKNTDQKLKVVCPNCEHKMLQVHYNFEVPSKNDSKSWKKLQMEMQHKLYINYEIYIKWHQLELKKTTLNSDTLSRLKRNLVKLENQSKN